jgi:hypothetical protein
MTLLGPQRFRFCCNTRTVQKRLDKVALRGRCKQVADWLASTQENVASAASLEAGAHNRRAAGAPKCLSTASWSVEGPNRKLGRQCFIVRDADGWRFAYSVSKSNWENRDRCYIAVTTYQLTFCYTMLVFPQVLWKGK